MLERKTGNPMFAPDTGADGVTATSTQAAVVAEDLTAETPTVTAEEEPDYKALYERAKGEYDKLKRSFDTTASEIAELKKKSKARMTEEEQRKAEQEEREQKYQDALSELTRIKTSSVFAKQGFAEADYAELSAKLVETCGAQASDVAEIIAVFLKKSNKAAVAQARNASIVDGARAPKASTGTGEAEHPYARIAVEQNGTGERTEQIKKIYRK